MRRKDNIKEVKDLRKMLNETRKLTLERFIMPEEEEDTYGYDEGDDEEVLRRDDSFSEQGDVSNIEKELIEIRKIALSVINRLADQTSSESYDTMKRIWSLVDKAIESKNDEDKKGNGNFSV